MDADHQASQHHGGLSRGTPTGRSSIYIEGFSHKNPIPAACRIGPLVESGSVLGTDPATGQVAPGIEAQCRQRHPFVAGSDRITTPTDTSTMPAQCNGASRSP